MQTSYKITPKLEKTTAEAAMEKNPAVSSSSSSSMKAMQKSLAFNHYYSPSISSSSSSNSIYYTPPCPSQLSSPDHPFHTAISSSSSQIEITQDQVEDCGTLLSKRLFFSPRTTSSIMEEREVRLVRRHGKNKSLDFLPLLSGPGTNSSACCSTTDCFCKESVQMEMRSDEPYRDFRESMGEMADAYGLRNCSELEKLLYCYLRLNDKNTHKIIRLAFVDLLMHFTNHKNSDRDRDRIFPFFN